MSSNLFLKLLTHILSDHKILKKLPTFFELTKQRQRKLRDIFYKGTPFEFWVNYKIKKNQRVDLYKMSNIKFVHSC